MSVYFVNYRMKQSFSSTLIGDLSYSKTFAITYQIKQNNMLYILFRLWTKEFDMYISKIFNKNWFRVIGKETMNHLISTAQFESWIFIDSFIYTQLLKVDVPNDCVFKHYILQLGFFECGTR